MLLERTILDLMKETLKMEDIDPDKVRKQKVVDREGKVFWKDFSSDIDVLVRDGNIYVFEIKATADKHEINHFLQVVRLYELVECVKVKKKTLIALRISPEVKRYAQDLGVHVIHG
ncbi:MAG: hypothetical protein ACTSRA_22780, partial [Promethearchaeota archaeon]